MFAVLVSVNVCKDIWLSSMIAKHVTPGRFVPFTAMGPFKIFILVIPAILLTTLTINLLLAKFFPEKSTIR
jgi:hypothetical protein